MNDAANRCRNIVAAIDNLLVQLTDEASGAGLYEKLLIMREVYFHEMVRHQADKE